MAEGDRSTAVTIALIGAAGVVVAAAIGILPAVLGGDHSHSTTSTTMATTTSIRFTTTTGVTTPPAPVSLPVQLSDLPPSTSTAYSVGAASVGGVAVLHAALLEPLCGGPAAVAYTAPAAGTMTGRVGVSDGSTNGQLVRITVSVGGRSAVFDREMQRGQPFVALPPTAVATGDEITITATAQNCATTAVIDGVLR